LIYREYLLREELGEKPSLTGFRERFPEHAERLKIQVELHSALRTRSIGGSADTIIQSASPALSIPGYEIIQELGRGGMGLVYKARHIGLDRVVALKVIREAAGIDPQSLGRFEIEGKAAARLRHAQIVQVYDVGQIDGRPYAALEYVEGGSLAAFLRGSPQSPELAAELVTGLAEAVQSAHDAGVIHRDLKPANVLLQNRTSRTAQGTGLDLGAWLPKIADFGLAKVLDLDQGLTIDRPLVGTPSYMAPEQAAGQGRSIGAAVDIYALGAILYELLTGRPPFKAATVSETMEQVRTADVVPPRRLRPALPVDIETICLKCLQKEPRDRYRYAGEVAEELGRYLRGEPVQARPVSGFNRAVRWCRRNPALAAASAAAVLAILCALGLATGMAVQQTRAATRLREEAQRAKRAEQVAAANEARALTEAENAKRSAQESRAVVAFFQDKVLAAARPKDQEGGLGREATIRDAIDAAEPLIPPSFTGQPSVEAAIRHALGTTYFYLGDPKLAITQLERARAQRQALLGTNNPVTLTSANALALSYRAAGRRADAVALAKETLELRRATLGPDHPDTLKSLTNLANTYRDSGRIPESIPLFEEALRRCRVALGPDHVETLNSMNNLANSRRDTGALTEAISLYEDTLRLRKLKLGPYHPDTLTTMHNLAAACWEAGRHVDAISLEVEALKGRRMRLGPDHTDTLHSMAGLAVDYWAVGRVEEAIPLYEEVLKLRRAKLGLNHADTLITMSDLALAYRDAGRLSEAIPLQEQAFRLKKSTLNPNELSTLATMDNLAEAYFAAGRMKEAQAMYEDAIKRMKANLSPGHFLTLDAMRGLARVYLAEGDYAATEKLLAEAQMAADKRQRDNPLPAADLRLCLGECLLKQRKYTQAETVLRECVQVREKRDPDAWETAWAKSLLAASLIGQKKYKEAEPLCLAGYECLKVREKRIPVPERSMVMTQAGQHAISLYDEWGKKDKAAEWRQRCTTSTPPAR
jgi:tetratricopeptide (TPR) repeat protein